MGEIKISVSDELNGLVQKIANKLGVKKTEYVKSLVIENLKELKLSGVLK